MKRRLLLLRHGRTEWNGSGRAQGHADVPLNSAGHAQARDVAPYLGSLGLVTIWSSDLARAQETAAYVASAAGLAVRLDKRLRETDVGEREGLTAEESDRRFPGWGPVTEPGSVRVRGAETAAEVTARSVAALTECLASLEPGETGLAVGHGLAWKLAVAGLLGWPVEAAGSLAVLGNCHWATLAERRRDGRVRLVGYGHSVADLTRG